MSSGDDAAPPAPVAIARRIGHPPIWITVAITTSVLALLIAHLSERAGLYPCPLCLTQRKAYWAAIGVGVLGLALARTALPLRPPPAATCLGLAACFTFGAGVAAYHAGVEWGWFAAPDTCAAGEPRGAIDFSTLERPMTVVSCAEAPFRLAGLSLAGWNALWSVLLAAGSVHAALRRRIAP